MSLTSLHIDKRTLEVLHGWKRERLLPMADVLRHIRTLRSLSCPVRTPGPVAPSHYIYLLPYGDGILVWRTTHRVI
jgi:hypothetical protein